MKKTILTFALMTAFGAFMLTSYAASTTNVSSAVLCEGGHKCDDKCKKNKNGECAEASSKSNDKAKASCCKKGEKSCHGKKIKSASKDKKGNTDPKS